MLAVQGVSFRYLGAVRNALNTTTLTLKRGECVLLWGANGSGKTTLAMALVGIIPNILRGNFTGEVLWNGGDLSRRLAPEIFHFLFQQPCTNLWPGTVAEEVSGIDQAPLAIQRAISILLDGIDWRRETTTLSVGQRQRVAIASAFALQKELLALDEPYTFLDREALDELPSLLRTAAEADRLVLVVEHFRGTRWQTQGDRAIQVEDGDVHEAQPRPPVPLPPIARQAPGGVVLCAQALGFRFPGERRPVLQSVDLELRQGEVVGIVGPNGSGKTTLLLILAGLRHPSTGSIFLGGRRARPKALRRETFYAFQNPDAQLFGTTVAAEITFALGMKGVGRREIEAHLRLAASLLPYDLIRDPFSLSFGQRKLLTLVMALLVRPTVLLLDEPLAGLDYENGRRVIQLLGDFVATGGSLVISGHERAEMDRIGANTVTL